MALLVFENVLELQNKPFDTRSFVGSIFAFGGITLGIGDIGAYGLTSPYVLVPLVVGVIAAALFVHRQLGLEHPFLDVRILLSKTYAISVVSSMLLYFAMMGSSVLMPLYVQTVMGRSAVTSGLVTLPGSLATALISPFAGKMYDKMGIRRIFIAGSVGLVISNLGMCTVSMATPLAVAACWNIIRNVSIGALMMPLLTWGTSHVEPKKVADASSLLTSFRTISGSIGSAVFVSIFSTVSAASAAIYGDGAMIRGIHAAFGAMGLCAVLLAAVAVLGTRNKNTTVKA
jgi:Na+/melibiose symporter-like transporter